ncbi:hypothetical protein ABZS88_26325 [Streptomyces sp. NPDC005480]|uniref:hypothetical protein n=1 Tax=Streptomyces sp. NPDC005480 TaxID=3154880 RepID=UPI0033B531C8
MSIALPRAPYGEDAGAVVGLRDLHVTDLHVRYGTTTRLELDAVVWPASGPN